MRSRSKRFALMTVAGMITAILACCILEPLRIKGNSMEPSITDGSIIVINRIAYFYQSPEPGDAVAFNCNVYSEDEEGSLLVRRVAAIGGDRVRITDGDLYVNDIKYEGYKENSIYLEPMNETVVGYNRVFVLSDSQTAVLDSRDQAVGQLRVDELTGKVCFR